MANFLTGAAYVLPLGILYRRWKSKNGVIFSMLVSTLTMTLVAGILNYLVFIPAFGWVMGYQLMLLLVWVLRLMHLLWI